MLVPLIVVPNVAEAHLLCGLLHTEGIECDQRATNFAVGSMDGMPGGGPREVLVDEHELARARELLAASRRSD